MLFSKILTWLEGFLSVDSQLLWQCHDEIHDRTDAWKTVVNLLIGEVVEVFYRSPVFLSHTIPYGSLVAWLLQSSFLNRHLPVYVTRSFLNDSYQKHLHDGVRKSTRVLTIVTKKSEQCGLWRIRLYALVLRFFAHSAQNISLLLSLYRFYYLGLPVFIFCLCIPLTLGKTSTEWVWEGWTFEEITKTGEKTEIWNP